LTKEIIIPGCSLPINLEYKDAIKIELTNHKATRISGAALEFYPYFIFEYSLDASRKDPVGGIHLVKNMGIHIIDALNGRFLSSSGAIDSANPLRRLHRIRNTNKTENLDLTTNTEINHIMVDLKTLKVVLDHKLVLNDDYEVNIIDDKISLKVAERKVLEKVISENTQEDSYYIRNGKGKKKKKIKIIPKFSEIIINRRSLIYVPRWIIIIKAGERTYRRKILAASKRLIFDEIYFCPKHFSLGKILRLRKQTSAVCEICGGAFCDDHIFKINDTYYCEKHRLQT
jgi:hypothetical protein